MELKELNSLSKHMKNVRSSQPCISMNFCIEFSKARCYKMFGKDKDRFGGGFMFYVNEQIPSKVLSLESVLLEFTIKSQRWLCVGIYRSPSQNEKYFIDHLSKTLGQLSCQYELRLTIKVSKTS